MKKVFGRVRNALTRTSSNKIRQVLLHYNAFNKTFLRELLGQEGFEVESMENTGTDVTVIAKKLNHKDGVCR